MRIPENPESNVPSMLMLLSLLVGAALVAEDLSDRSFAELLLRPNAMPTRFVRRHPAAGEHHRLHGQMMGVGLCKKWGIMRLGERFYQLGLLIRFRSD